MWRDIAEPFIWCEHGIGCHPSNFRYVDLWEHMSKRIPGGSCDRRCRSDAHGEADGFKHSAKRGRGAIAIPYTIPSAGSSLVRSDYEFIKRVRAER